MFSKTKSQISTIKNRISFTLFNNFKCYTSKIKIDLIMSLSQKRLFRQ